MVVQHPGDDELEDYAVNRLAEEAAALIEEHLLICGACRGRLARWDEYVTAMRKALGRGEGPKPSD